MMITKRNLTLRLAEVMHFGGVVPLKHEIVCERKVTCEDAGGPKNRTASRVMAGTTDVRTRVAE